MGKKLPKKVHVLSFLRDAANARLDDPKSRESLPTLLECLMPVYDGATLVRQPGRLTIAAEGAHWKITLDCPTEVLQARFSTNILEFALRDIEEALASGHIIWAPGWSRNKKKLPTIDDPIQ